MISDLSPIIPPLPKAPNAWSSDILDAHKELCDWYSHALGILSSEDNDATRLRVLANELDLKSKPLCAGLSSLGVPDYWVNAVVETISGARFELEQTAHAIAAEYA